MLLKIFICLVALTAIFWAFVWIDYYYYKKKGWEVHAEIDEQNDSEGV